MAVSPDIGHKLNISQTYVRSIQVLFPGEWERALHGHYNNMINVNIKPIKYFFRAVFCIDLLSTKITGSFLMPKFNTNIINCRGSL